MSPTLAILFAVVALGSLLTWIRGLPGLLPTERDRAFLFWPGSLTTLLLVIWIALSGIFVGSFLVAQWIDVPSPWANLFATLAAQTSIIAACLTVSIVHLRDPLLGLFVNEVPASRPLATWSLFALLRFLPLVWATSLLWILFLNSIEPLVGDLGLDQGQQEVVLLLLSDQPWPLLVAVALLAIIGAPIAEEIAFRGVLFRFLRKSLSFPAAAILSSIPFSLLHASLLQFAPLAVLGGCLCLVFEQTRDLRACILVHAFFNTLSIAMIFAA